jgi:hypothetical protein
MVGLLERFFVVCIISRVNTQEPWRAADIDPGAAISADEVIFIPGFNCNYLNASIHRLISFGDVSRQDAKRQV